MATRIPNIDDLASSAAVESASSIPHSTAPSSAPLDPDYVKLETSPTPSGPNSADADTPGTDGCGPAGRKRKLNSMSARGVANLTPDQLAKKRANDRQAQRAIRERTKSHIDALELQVRELSSQKPFLDLQSALKQNEAIQAENREIRRSLKAMMDIIQPLVGKHESSNSPATGSAPVQTSIAPLSTSSLLEHHTSSHNSHRTAPPDQSFSESITSTPSSTHSAPIFGTSGRGSATGPAGASFRIAFDYQRHHLAHGLDFGADERMGFDFLLDASQRVPRVESFHRSAETVPTVQMTPPSAYPSPSEDQSASAHQTPVRNIPPTCTLDAILLDFLHNRQRQAAKGVPRQKLVGPPYPSVSSLLNPEMSVYSHPLSKVFTDVLRTFPDISSLPEQVAVLYTMFLLMRWQIYSTPENYDRLPEWLTPRPSQILTPHPAWMDYLPWPRMRDRVIMAHKEYPFESWFIPYTRTLSVNWPYEPTDCLLSTGDSDELIINPVFERHLRNLHNWTLGPAFVDAFPGLAETARIKNTS
ncbi:bZIP transcription factor [Aspergillus candidus]|uniref:BZIP transcription factor n=1 Tax=Aspergillus candidus TaxID=41067 RepID=A0A2I2F330_ASPCN|nr:bZIP transcription factor [Aspergillus candidus]PLB35034.1 bZIP transcription factor [Aspergillus candidus]